jgi:P2 family phage contractile tail tube protein
MLAIQVNRITNANLFINGNSMLGRADELTLPDLKAKMSEHKAIGMVGSLELISGFEKIEAKIKWNSYYQDALGSFAYNPYKAVQLQVRASVEGYDSTGRIAQLPLVTFLIGQFKNLPMGTFKQHDNVEFESMINCTAIKQIYNGKTVLEYDCLANILKVQGQDLLAQYRLNIGA